MSSYLSGTQCPNTDCSPCFGFRDYLGTGRFWFLFISILLVLIVAGYICKSGMQCKKYKKMKKSCSYPCEYILAGLSILALIFFFYATFSALSCTDCCHHKIIYIFFFVILFLWFLAPVLFFNKQNTRAAFFLTLLLAIVFILYFLYLIRFSLTAAYSLIPVILLFVYLLFLTWDINKLNCKE